MTKAPKARDIQASMTGLEALIGQAHAIASQISVDLGLYADANNIGLHASGPVRQAMGQLHCDLGNALAAAIKVHELAGAFAAPGSVVPLTGGGGK